MRLFDANTTAPPLEAHFFVIAIVALLLPSGPVDAAPEKGAQKGDQSLPKTLSLSLRYRYAPLLDSGLVRDAQQMHTTRFEAEVSVAGWLGGGLKLRLGSGMHNLRNKEAVPGLGDVTRSLHTYKAGVLALQALSWQFMVGALGEVAMGVDNFKAVDGDDFFGTFSLFGTWMPRRNLIFSLGVSLSRMHTGAYIPTPLITALWFPEGSPFSLWITLPDLIKANLKLRPWLTVSAFGELENGVWSLEPDDDEGKDPGLLYVEVRTGAAVAFGPFEGFTVTVSAGVSPLRQMLVRDAAGDDHDWSYGVAPFAGLTLGCERDL